jgi:short-subunit dehydrogenase
LGKSIPLGKAACCREALDRMIRKGDGHILLIGSMSADLREEGKDIYVATMAGSAPWLGVARLVSKL